jgi:hypothetical protein
VLGRHPADGEAIVEDSLQAKPLIGTIEHDHRGKLGLQDLRMIVAGDHFL